MIFYLVSQLTSSPTPFLVILLGSVVSKFIFMDVSFIPFTGEKVP